MRVDSCRLSIRERIAKSRGKDAVGRLSRNTTPCGYGSLRSQERRMMQRANSHTFAFSRREAPEVLLEILAPSKNRGRRESRVSDAPAAARGVVGSTRVSHHEFTGNIRLSPRNGFNGLYRALPGDRALLPPSLALSSAQT